MGNIVVRKSELNVLPRNNKIKHDADSSSIAITLRFHSLNISSQQKVQDERIMMLLLNVYTKSRSF
jgi:hypothetical protein